jgi:hypothetical protein
MGKTGGSFPHAAAAAAASYHTAPYGCFVCVCVFEEESIVESCRAKEEGKFLVV